MDLPRLTPTETALEYAHDLVEPGAIEGGTLAPNLIRLQPQDAVEANPARP